jgi:phosphoglycolate phosphatase
MDPLLLKPDIHLVDQALAVLDAPPSTAVFVGDTTDDMEAGRAAGVRTIGYANKPGKRERLGDAGADALVEAMDDLAAALRAASIQA